MNFFAPSTTPMSCQELDMIILRGFSMGIPPRMAHKALTVRLSGRLLRVIFKGAELAEQLRNPMV